MADSNTASRVEDLSEKAVSAMTEAERRAFRMSFDPDSMGFDGAEGVADDAVDHP